MVAAGDVLARFEDATLTAAVTQAEANLASARAGVAQAEAQVRSAEADARQARVALGRTQALRDRGDAAQATLDQAQAVADQAEAGVGSGQAQLEAARAAVAQSEAALEIVRTNVGWTTIEAPVAADAAAPQPIAEGGRVLPRPASRRPHARAAMLAYEAATADQRAFGHLDPVEHPEIGAPEIGRHPAGDVAALIGLISTVVS